jgi:hypothetical protein
MDPGQEQFQAILGALGSLTFGAADFSSSDAGCGSLENTRVGLDAALLHHMNSAATNIVPDARDVLRPWHRRLQHVLGAENDRLLAFLQTSTSEDTETAQRHQNFLMGLNTESFSSSSSWMEQNVRPMVTKDECLAELDRDLGFPLQEARSRMHTIMDVYTAVLGDMFVYNDRLNTKLTTLETLQRRLADMPIASTDVSGASVALNALQSATLDYVRATYAGLGLAEDYVGFCKTYARFQALRSVMLLLYGAGSETPLCSICTVEKVVAAVVPCGHTFCNNCVQKQRGTCFVCRTPVRDRQRLYFI